MKDSYPQISLARLCRLFGITRQAFYQHFWNLSDITMEQGLVLERVREIRERHPVIGCRKLYCLLQSFLVAHQIKMGRDALFDLLSDNKLLVKKRRRTIHTTQSRHWLKKYPNLIKDWRPQKPVELWVADITYVQVSNGFLYLNLLTDAYSHKIVGHCIAPTLEAVYTAKALQLALKNNHITGHRLIHHSDRGIQYCCAEYVAELKKHDIEISMTQSGDPLENAVAERINGIIKEEYLNHFKITNQQQGVKLLDTIVDRYNKERPHQSINMLTPELVHEQKLLVNRGWSKKHSLNIVY